MLGSAQRRWVVSILARVEYISPVDKSTGKAELRFHLGDIDKTVGEPSPYSFELDIGAASP